MLYAKRPLEQRINASVAPAQQMSQLHCATTVASHTRTNVNTTTKSVWDKKNPVSNTMADANVSPYQFYVAEYFDRKMSRKPKKKKIMTATLSLSSLAPIVLPVNHEKNTSYLYLCTYQAVRKLNTGILQIPLHFHAQDILTICL